MARRRNLRAKRWSKNDIQFQTGMPVYLFNIIYSQFTSGVRRAKIPSIKWDAYALWCCVTHRNNVAFMSRLHRKTPSALPFTYIHHLHCNFLPWRIKSNVNICLFCMKKKSIFIPEWKKGITIYTFFWVDGGREVIVCRSDLP